MKIVWFSWKDIKHPQAGGAEKVTHELAKRFAEDGHEFVLITSKPNHLKVYEVIDGYNVERKGNRITVYWHAYRQFKNHKKDTDAVIEEVNTIPFFTQLYSNQKRFLFFHQLAREVWFYQGTFPLNLVGYLLEPVYLWFLRKNKVITVSNSTKEDLMRYGFRSKNISIIPQGIDLEPVKDPSKIKKFKDPTLLSFGAVRPMKRTLHQIKAFEMAKKDIKNLRLIIAGSISGKYAKKVLRYVHKSPYKTDITVLGRVDKEKKVELMRCCHLQLATSIKEGWGLTVTEAASQGTNTAGYDVDGLRDSIGNVNIKLLSKPHPKMLANKIVENINSSVSGEQNNNSFDQTFVIFNDYVKKSCS